MEAVLPGQVQHLSSTDTAAEETTPRPQPPPALPSPVMGPPAPAVEEAAEPVNELEVMRAKYNKLQLETMHGMTEEVEYGLADKKTSVRYVYLTNNQAVSIPAENMTKVLRALGLNNRFSMVIRIMPCQMGNTWWRSYPYSNARFPEKKTPELDESQAERTEHQLLLLAKEIILPHAMSCKALVLGQEGCSLTAAFLKVSNRLMQERGVRCPFRTLVMCRAPVFHLATKNPKSVVYNFWKCSPNWKNQQASLEKAMRTRFGGDPAYWPQMDLPTGTYTMLMFECLSQGKICEKALHGFQHDFISSLMDDVPVLAVATFGTDRMNFLPTMSEHVNRGMPLVLIDSRVRDDLPPDSLEALASQLKALKERLHKAHVGDWYSTSALAFVRECCDRLREMSATAAAEQRLKGSKKEKQAKHLVSREQRKMWIHEAITRERELEARERELEAKAAAPKPRPPRQRELEARDGELDIKAKQRAPDTSPQGRGKSQADVKVVPEDASLEDAEAGQKKHKKEVRLAGGKLAVLGAVGHEPVCEVAKFCDGDLVTATNLLMKHFGGELEWEMNERHRRCNDALSRISASSNFEEFRGAVNEQWMNIRGCCFHRVEDMSDFVAENLWCVLQDKGEMPSARWCRGRYFLEIDPSKVPAPSDTGALSFEQAKDKFIQLIKNIFKVSEAMDKHHLTTRAFTSEDPTAAAKWMAVHDILSSKHISVGSLHDLKDCKRKLSRCSVLDHLPEENTLEALICLRTAWNLTELYSSASLTYGRIAKTFYFCLLILQLVMITIVTVRAGSSTLGDALLREYWLPHAQKILLALSLVCSLITGFTQLVAPTRKWTRMKGAALRMESEIWKFRTRHGDYDVQRGFWAGLTFEREAERHFAENIGHIADYVKNSAGMNRSAFFATSSTTPDTTVSIEDERKGIGNFKISSVMATKLRNTRQRFWHGQRDVGQAELRPGEDNHHSPQSPDHFVYFRLVPARDRIQRKIPRLARLYSLLQVFLLCTTILNTGLAATTDGTVTAILAGGSGLVTAWQEFLSVEQRLDSYSKISKRLDALILWWQALPEEEKHVQKNIDHLIGTTEKQLELLVSSTPGTSETELSSSKAKKADARLDVAS